ncbi:hypothetical protein [Halobacterium zhouii]|uniref:hypothetical protein n=1 Tax=Halobacterium zhouii TaxID=2902624 RepID=UPI001E5DBF43|nr:hypothetical protein [Halobacterium zhouii]
MSEAPLVRFGFPGFWIGIGVIQWYWPAAIFPAFSNEDVTPGARGFAVAWLLVGAVLGYVFVPGLGAFSGWFVPGFVLVVVGLLQAAWPAWSPPAGIVTERQYGTSLAGLGVAVLVFGLL